jgi:hypothetical protein
MRRFDMDIEALAEVGGGNVRDPDGLLSVERSVRRDRQVNYGHPDTTMANIDSRFTNHLHTESAANRHFDREIIVLCARWYLRYKLGLRDLVEMIPQGDFLRGVAERGVSRAHATIMRWAKRFTP